MKQLDANQLSRVVGGEGSFSSYMPTAWGNDEEMQKVRARLDCLQKAIQPFPEKMVKAPFWDGIKAPYSKGAAARMRAYSKEQADGTFDEVAKCMAGR